MASTIAKPKPWTRLVHGLGAALAVGVVIYFLRALDLPAVAEHLRNARVLPLVLGLLVGSTISLLVALQWWLFSAPEQRGGFWHVWRYTVLAVGAWTVLPSVVGVGAAAAVFAASGIGAVQSATILGLDQLGAGLAKGLLFLATAALVPLAGSRAGAAPLILLALALAGLVALSAVAAWSKRHASSPWMRRLASLPDARRLFAGMGLACAVKLAEGLVMACVDGSLSIAPSLSRTLLTLSGASFSTLIGVGPANLGLYEGAVFVGYRLSGVAADAAGGAAVLQHAAALVPPLALAAGVLGVGALRRAFTPGRGSTLKGAR